MQPVQCQLLQGARSTTTMHKMIHAMFIAVAVAVSGAEVHAHVCSLWSMA